MKQPQTVLLEPVRGGPMLVCPDYNRRRVIDGHTFVEVRPLNSDRLNWMNLGSLRRVKSPFSDK
jgi:hypothetical protein